MIASRQPIAGADVARHYDELDAFYRDVWGEHVHHGLWLRGDESRALAVRQLADLVANEAAVGQGTRVIDIGCGYGATARLLATERRAEVTAITISAAQHAIAVGKPSSSFSSSSSFSPPASAAGKGTDKDEDEDEEKDEGPASPAGEGRDEDEDEEKDEGPAFPAGEGRDEDEDEEKDEGHSSSSAPIRVHLRLENSHRHPTPRYLLGDWLHNSLPAAAFDSAIAIESSEHMPDKPRFFAEAARVLRPGGRLVICAWLAAERPTARQERWLIEPICREGRMPHLGSESDYRALATAAGFTVERVQDVTRQIARTWPTIVRTFLLKLLHRPAYLRFLLDRHAHNRIFALTTVRLWIAFRTGAMRYGVFTLRKE